MTTSDIPLQERFPTWAGDLLAIIVVLGTALMPSPRPPLFHQGTFVLFLFFMVLTAVVLIPLRHRWPISVLVASLILYCATAFLDAASTGIGIAAIVAAYSVGNQTSRHKTLILGGLGTILVGVLSLTTSRFGVVEPRIFQIAAGIAVAAALGDSSRSHSEFLRVANERAERAELNREVEAQRRVAEEKLRIARDLHDTVAHQISVISLNAGVASHALDKDPEKARAALLTIRTAARGVLTEIGGLLRYLRTDAAPLTAEPPQFGLGNVDELIAQMNSSGMNVTLQRSGDLSRVVGSTDVVAYRIIQEGLTNAHKHGAQKTADLSVTVSGDKLEISITNPVALDRNNGSDLRGEGLGLIGIKERVESVGGTVATEATENSFKLDACLPLRQQELS